jgi:hypothetical protein
MLRATCPMSRCNAHRPVSRSARRQGHDGKTAFNIRGLGGNRVPMLLDGVRQPRSCFFQGDSSMGRDHLAVAWSSVSSACA